MCHVNRDSLMHCSQGSVAQLVEQRTSNRRSWVRIPPKNRRSWVRIPPEPLNFSIIQLVISVLVIIIDEAQVSSFETFYSKLESPTIVLLSKYIE